MKIIKCNGCPEKEATLDIATMRPGTVFLYGGELAVRSTLPLFTEGFVVILKDGYAYTTPSLRAEPLDSDYLIPKEQK